MKKQLLVLAFLLSTSAAMAQLQAAVDTICVKHQLMGLSLLTYSNGKVTGTYHAGLKDYERKLAIDDSTMFRMASISKLVTSTGLMMLYDQKRFGLDEDVSGYLGFPFRNPSWPAVPITFRMLMSHTASLNDGDGYADFLAAIYSNPDTIPTLKELVLPGGVHYTPDMWLPQKPGTYFTYCNANFGVVATLIERISGRRFDQYMRDSLLLPLAVKGSYNVADIEQIDQVAALYRNEEGWAAQVDEYKGERPAPRDLSAYELGTNGFIFSPQGGLRISVPDLAKIMQLHIDGGMYMGRQLISSSTLKLMHTPQWRFNGSNGDSYNGLFLCWGLGVQIITNTPNGDFIAKGVPLMGHAGDAYGLISGMYFNPQSKVGFIYLTNGAFGGFTAGRHSAYYTFEEDIFDALAKAGSLRAR